MKIAFIGGGAMGEAMLSAVLSQKLSTPQDIWASDIKPERRQHLAQSYGINVTDKNRDAVSRSEITVLAIKPQNLAEIMTDLKGAFKPSQLVLSIIAGVRLATLRQGLAHDAIVRVMPNTPAQIGMGMSAWTVTPEVTATQKKQAQAILSVMGKETYFDDEKYIDMATAVSGSGPAYFFLFVEALTDAAVKIGIPRDMAGQLVMQTMLGSVHLLQKSGRPPAELRRKVTSPGGTTAAAIARFEQGDFSNLILQAVTAAYQRAQELGK
jgi:pyrroline-5-carboxylate reductase